MQKDNSAKNKFRPFKQLNKASDVVRQFTPNWFTMNMGTGILSLMLAAFPYHVTVLLIAAKTLWIINILPELNF